MRLPPKIYRKISIHAPRRGSDVISQAPSEVAWYFNPRSPQGERHTSRETKIIFQNFNPRSPQGERLCKSATYTFTTRFQSTLPAGGATSRNYDILRLLINFNPRSPQGERHTAKRFTLHTLYFNPRSPQGERPPPFCLYHTAKGFQSTLPAGGATSTFGASAGGSYISIHAPRRGSD